MDAARTHSQRFDAVEKGGCPLSSGGQSPFSTGRRSQLTMKLTRTSDTNRSMPYGLASAEYRIMPYVTEKSATARRRGTPVKQIRASR